jgi:FHA domain
MIRGVNDMIAEIAFIVFAANPPVSTNILIIAALIIAVVILVGAVFLFRSPGKKKGAKADQATGAATWQPQGQQQGGWNQQGNMASPSADNAWGQQPQAGGWGAPAGGQQPQAGGWGSPNSGTLAPGPGMGGGQSSWDATFAPSSQQPAAAQDQRGQAQAGSSVQQNPSPWGMQSNAPSQQDRTAYGGGLGQSWGQPSPAQQDRTAYGGSSSGPAWGQTSGQAADPWNMAPAQQSVPDQQGWGQPAQPPSPASAMGGNTGMPSWQPGQNQGGFGSTGMRQDAGAMFGSADSDKTMLRPSGVPSGVGTGPQGVMGIVRVEEGKEPGRVYEVRKETLSIGRSRESDIFLEDLAVSRLHASIVNQGNGNYALRDEGSANGTKVNGQLVNKYQVYPLNEGDKIQLGQTVLVFARR